MNKYMPLCRNGQACMYLKVQNDTDFNFVLPSLIKTPKLA